MAVANAPRESLSKKLVGSSRMTIWGRFHRPAPNTTLIVMMLIVMIMVMMIVIMLLNGDSNDDDSHPHPKI